MSSVPSSPFVAYPGKNGGESGARSPIEDTSELKRKISLLEFQCQELKDRNEIDHVRHESEQRGLRSEVETRLRENEGVVSDLKLLYDENSELKRQIRQLEVQSQALGEQNSVLRMELTAKSTKLNEHVIEFQEIEKQLEEAVLLKEKEHDSKLREQQRLVSDLEHELGVKSAEVAELLNRLKVKDGQITELRERSQRHNESQARELYERECSSQLEYIRELEEKNLNLSNKVREFQSKYEYSQILKEEKNALAHKVAVLEGVEKEYGMLKVQFERLSSSSESELVQRCQNLELANARIQTSLENVRRELAQSQQDYIGLQSKLLQANDEQTELRHTIAQKETDLVKATNASRILEQEIKLLKERIESVAEENRLLLNNGSAGVDTGNERGDYEQLVKLVESYKREVAELREAGATKRMRLASENEAGANGYQTIVAQLKERVGENGALRAKIDELARENAELKSSVAAAAAKAANARAAVTSSTNEARVLEMKDNPTARHEKVTQQMVKLLRAENEDLSRNRWDRWDGVETVPRSVYKRVSADQAELVREVGALSKRLTRLKEVYTSKTARFNEIIYLLLGYKVELLSETRVRLVPRLSSDGSVVVELTRGRRRGTGAGATGVQLADGGDSVRVRLPGARVDAENLVRFWVADKGEPCCLLSALNLELFDKLRDGE